jgi:hypothetical protein
VSVFAGANVPVMGTKLVVFDKIIQQIETGIYKPKIGEQRKK